MIISSAMLDTMDLSSALLAHGHVQRYAGHMGMSSTLLDASGMSSTLLDT